MAWGSPEEVERRKRILVAVWAYAYEFRNVSLVSDHTFDEMCYSIDASIGTGRPELDAFFRDVFQPHTGQWIWKHPELDKVAIYYQKVRQFYDAREVE